MRVRKIGLILTALMSLNILAGCGSNKTENNDKTISLMVPLMMETAPKDDCDILKALEEKTGYKVNITWVPNTSYADKFSITMASDKCPEIIVSGKSAAALNLVKKGAFWKLDDYLGDYPNLAKEDEKIKLNASFNGETYGIYRIRDVARFATIIRKDWLDKLGLKEPKTLEEFTAMLKAFKNNDPDGNGKNDTYGMIVPKWGAINAFSPFDQMAVWFGAPNVTKVEDGKVSPDFMTDEYMKSLDYFKMLYDEGLMNNDFAVRETDKWNDDFLNGKAGVIVDTQTRAFQIAEAMAERNGRKDGNGDQWVTMISNVTTPSGGDKVLPSSGYSSMMMIPKQSVKDEKQLKKVLDFLDKINSEDIAILLQRGIEGKQYEVKGNEYVDIVTGDTAVDQANTMNLNSFWQMSPNVANYDLREEDKGTNLEKRGKELLKDGLNKMVVNETEPLMSDVFVTKGVQMTNIMTDARIQYVAGQIDKEGYKKAIDLWLKTGGQEYVDELTKLYNEKLKK
ncbi:extracellular solute-binding protein [Clostridium sp. SHJSY1]|uniref:extracellular solute-binding protein n=1 Tax=Clostridium sp. SHJSY1 TaxID=2942483 RepID=UPI0028745588|nr:extracellular solute-binding protein [Clostridium sp. SHJSY1]MDS0527622.1 extracellular solute-binding protein [Clostridium sp. SHJSY1]